MVISLSILKFKAKCIFKIFMFQANMFYGTCILSISMFWSSLPVFPHINQACASFLFTTISSPIKILGWGEQDCFLKAGWFSQQKVLFYSAITETVYLQIQQFENKAIANVAHLQASLNQPETQKASAHPNLHPLLMQGCGSYTSEYATHLQEVHFAGL